MSIVMAAYDAAAYVAAAVESVLAQTHDDWELLIADDGSTDGTPDVVSGFADPRIRLLPGEHVGVLAQVRNRAIAQARGDAVALLDADDTWLDRKLELQVRVLRERADVGVVHSGAVVLADGQRSRAPRPPRGSMFGHLLENNFIFSSSVLVRRSLLELHGAFDEDPALDGSPDYDLWLRLAPYTEFAYLDEALLVYRVHAGQMSGRVRSMNRGALVALERALERDPERVWGERAAYLLGLGMRRCIAGEPGYGSRDIAHALLRRPLSARGWAWLVRSLSARIR